MKRTARKTAKKSLSSVVTFGISLPADLLKRIDERCGQESIPNRSHYLRQLAQRDLSATKPA